MSDKLKTDAYEIKANKQCLKTTQFITQRKYLICIPCILIQKSLHHFCRQWIAGHEVKIVMLVLSSVNNAVVTLT